MNISHKIAGLLHLQRSSSATLEITHELTATTREASSDEVKAALLLYGLDLLQASQQIYTLQHAIAERDAHTGDTH